MKSLKIELPLKDMMERVIHRLWFGDVSCFTDYFSLIARNKDVTNV